MPHTRVQTSSQKPAIAQVVITMPADEVDQVVLHLSLRALTQSIIGRSAYDSLTNFENDNFLIRDGHAIDDAFEVANDRDTDPAPEDVAIFIHKPTGLMLSQMRYWDEPFTIANGAGVDIPAMMQECFASLAAADVAAAA
ncbi:hypothetical protein ACOI1H_21465 [Loktanella sp. DJP18]|uniref:hypothetical protein n=1 Tax=Loktanella sp. DJP18 TaxID=3409788 RepID=UPI003BB5E2AC